MKGVQVPNRAGAGSIADRPFSPVQGHRTGFSQPPSYRRGDHPAVLLIDDDPGTRETVRLALRPMGFRVETAASAAEGLAIARLGPFDVMLVDLRLPDMFGIELVRALRKDVGDLRFVLLSGFLTTAVTVEAMKLGALDVIEKPVCMDDLVALVCSIVTDNRPIAVRGRSGRVEGTGQATMISSCRVRPGCAAERWAMHVLKGCESLGDLKTLRQWALSVGVSYTSLRESCRLVGIRPHDARDFTRVLRAVMHSRGQRCAPEVLLDVSDSRTLTTLLERAGLDVRHRSGSMSVEQFLSGQRFVEAKNAGLGFLNRLLAGTDPS